jgi:hypothetical protein
VTGRFLVGNQEAVTHGERRNLDRPDLAEAVKHVELTFAAHVAGSEQMAPTMAGYVRSTARLAVLEESAWLALVKSGGIITGKGNIKALFTAWDRLDEKLTKRLERLGLERQTRNVGFQSIHEYHFAEEAAREATRRATLPQDERSPLTTKEA